MEFEIGLGVSARHLHLCRKDMDILFGKGSELTMKKPISQPGQFASNEQVILRTDKGDTKLRVLGPLRPYTQIELGLTDARKAGLEPPIRLSGDLKGSAAGLLVGPAGSVEIDEGIIIASRHVHLCPATAAKLGLKNGDTVDLVTDGPRALVLKNVIVRASEKDADEVHIDTDEANACNLPNGAKVKLVWNK